MDREVAVRLLSAINAMTPAFDELTSVSWAIADGELRKAFRLKIAEAMKIVGYELVMRIVRQYPYLDPDKDPSKYKKS